MWLVALLVSWVMTNENIGEQLQKVEKYSGSGSIIECDRYDNMTFFNGTATCAERWSQLAVYRIFFGTFLFFIIMALVTFKVKSTKDIRAGLQNSFWFFKIAGWIALVVAAFYINNTFFTDAWGYIGLVGSFFFMIIQGIILINISHSWSMTYNTSEVGSGARCFIPFITVFLDLAVIAISVCLYVYYTFGDSRGGCTTNKALISFNFVMFFVMSFLGLVSPRNYDGTQGTVGLTPPALISFYTTYLTWSAIAETKDDCLPGSIVNGTLVAEYDASDYLTTVLGVALAVFVVGALSNIKAKGAEEGTEQDVEGVTEEGKTVKIKMYTAQDNEENTVYYHWSLFHLSIAMACLYTMNVLTNWATIRDRVSSSEIEIGNSDAPVWVQAVAAWIVMFMFLFDMLMPVCGPKCFPDRVWSHGEVTG